MFAKKVKYLKNIPAVIVSFLILVGVFVIPHKAFAYQDETDCETKCSSSCVQDTGGQWQCPAGEKSGTSVVTPGASGTTSTGGKPAIEFNKLQNDLNSTGYHANLNTLGGIVSAFLPYVFGLAGITLFLYFIWGGFTIMMSKGDPKATAAGKDRITRAIVGFVIIFAAYWIVQILGLVFGISQFKNIF